MTEVELVLIRLHDFEERSARHGERDCVCQLDEEIVRSTLWLTRDENAGLSEHEHNTRLRDLETIHSGPQARSSSSLTRTQAASSQRRRAWPLRACTSRHQALVDPSEAGGAGLPGGRRKGRMAQHRSPRRFDKPTALPVPLVALLRASLTLGKLGGVTYDF